MEKELDRCGRDSITLGVFLCDFDRFKHINDHLGHLEGNRLLRAFADELKQACREYDCVARMGGDEFVVVAPGLSPQAGSDVIARIADSAERAGSLVCQGYYVSVSVGSAFYPSDGLTTEALLTEADRRMYQAKQERQEKLKPKEHVQSRGAHA
jgi:diguanylate cyclase (GGDEF)-like protein